MKKILFATVPLAFALMLTGCAKKQRTLQPCTLPTATYKADSVATPGAGASCDVAIEIEYPSRQPALADSLMRSGVLQPDYYSIEYEHKDVPTVVNEFIAQYIADFTTDAKAILQQEPDSKDMEWTYHVSARLYDGFDRNIICIARIDSHEGGADAISYTVAKNIDSKSGHAYHVGELVEAADMPKLIGRITDELCDANGCDNLDELKKKGIFAEVAPFAPDNFILTDDEITFIYTPGSIAPVNKGEIKVAIDTDDANIKPALWKKS